MLRRSFGVHDQQKGLGEVKVALDKAKKSLQHMQLELRKEWEALSCSSSICDIEELAYSSHDISRANAIFADAAVTQSRWWSCAQTIGRVLLVREGQTREET